MPTATVETPAVFAFDNTYARQLEGFYQATAPEPVAKPRMLRLNHALAEDLGARALSDLPHGELASLFTGNTLFPGSDPLAQAYAGHQFGGFSPSLGDGRAHLLGEVKDRHGRRRDIALKGSGRTQFSRSSSRPLCFDGLPNACVQIRIGKRLRPTGILFDDLRDLVGDRRALIRSLSTVFLDA